ncbi:MAG: tripartite tricarboxylate transporter family receptor [Hyphomicrobiales bacterium]|nr:tripartite tricarboxylate transporter family receptor [Hyphomicrobiales bacterium]
MFHDRVTQARLACMLGMAACVTPVAAQAQSVAEFYKGKTITILVGAAAGGAYDLVSRTVASHMGRHIPGQPRFIVSNMPGASSLPMVNHLTNAAKRDGTVMGMTNSNIALERPLKMLSKGGGHVGFDVSKLQWIGSPLQQPHVLWVWHEAPARNAEDLRKNEVLIGTTGAGGDNFMVPTLMNRILGTKMKIVSGYEGQSDIFIAAERGEIHGNSAVLPNLTSAKPDWYRDKKVRVLVQFGVNRQPALPDIPTAIELASDPDDREMLRFYALKFSMAYPFVVAPETPADRVAALRDAFDATMKDPEFLGEAKRLGLDIDPFTGAQMAQLIQDIDAAPRRIVDRVADIIMPKKK